MIRSGSAHPLWGVTCFYDAMHNSRRLINYRTFRQRFGAPLVAVELAYDEEFQLNESDAEVLIQLRGQDVLWQTERLFNVGIEAVPRDCQKIAWIDCDLVLDRDDWAEATSELLDRFALVQPFRKFFDQTSDAPPGDISLNYASSTSVSLASAILKGGSPEGLLHNDPSRPTGRNQGVSGGVWASRRDVLNKPGLYDACILGGNDRAMVGAAYGLFQTAIDNWQMNARQVQHYLAWARPFFDSVQGRVGYVDGSILHLWHGDPLHRKTIPRYDGLRPFDFDPFCDIAVSDHGPWNWNTNKTALHQYVRKHFESRESQ